MSSRNTSLWRAHCLGTASAQKTSDASCSRATASAAGTSTKEPAEQLPPPAPCASLAVLRNIILHTDAARGALVGRRRGSRPHERRNHDGRIHRPIALRASQRRSLPTRNLAVLDDCGVCLRPAATSPRQTRHYNTWDMEHSLGRAVARRTVRDRQARHANAVCARDLGNDAVGRDGSRQRGDDSKLREVHVGD